MTFVFNPSTIFFSTYIGSEFLLEGTSGDKSIFHCSNSQVQGPVILHVSAEV